MKTVSVIGAGPADLEGTQGSRIQRDGIRSQRKVRWSLVTFVILLLMGALGSAPLTLALPITYCPGSNNPCHTVCECPTGVSPCDQSNPPPCCLGSDPCAVAAAPAPVDSNEVGPFVGPLLNGDDSLAVIETVTVGGYRPGTVVVELFDWDGDRVVSQTVKDLSKQTYHAKINLSSLRGGNTADSFRIYIDHSKRGKKHPRKKKERETVAPPAVFHVVEPDPLLTEEDKVQILNTLGTLRSTRRVHPELCGGKVCGSC